MTITEALETRHSVRQFTEQAIDEKNDCGTAENN
jgi:hypothetical protein